MKVLYFDCFSGISGDMTLGALLDLGIDQELFKSELDKLNLAGYEIIIEKKVKEGIAGTDVQVVINEEYGNLMKRMEKHCHFGGDHHHNHEHHNDDRTHKNHGSRNLTSIEALIDASSLKPGVKGLSKKVFQEIARAEAKVHNKNITEVHFHEVGAIDSIVDIVGVAICLDLLGIKEVYASPLHDGQGFVECAHGLLPVPVPAVLEMLANSKIPVIIENVNAELITPTGIGLIKSLTGNYGSMPVMIIDKIGYGMGKRETGRLNALRVVMGTLLGQDTLMEEISMLETNIDDLSPEILGFTMEKLMENGALDVFYTPIYMKKNRPAVKLTVLAQKDMEDQMVNIMFKETSTLGIRRSTTTRYFMEREITKVDTSLGEVRFKVASKGDLKKAAPEYEDCKEIANRTGMPLINVYHILNAQVEDLF